MAAVPLDCRSGLPYPPPPFTPVEATRRPAEGPSVFPFQDAAAPTPPMCLRNHWDPEQIIRRTLPAGPSLAAPLDPRPWTKVCMEYVTSQDFEDAPRPSDDMVFPGGGTVYPPSRWRESIQTESELRRLDRPHGTCEKDQFVPRHPGDTLPERRPVSSRFISELAMPAALMRPNGTNGYPCRVEAEQVAFRLSPLPFNNATKQNRVHTPGLAQTLTRPRPPLGTPAAMPQNLA